MFFPQQFRRPMFRVRFILFPPLCGPRPFGMNHKWTMQQSCISVANRACDATREAVTAGLHCSCISSLPGRRLRSSFMLQLHILPYRLSTAGRRSFPVAASIFWNILPDDVQSAPSVSSFRRQLKTFSFHQSFPDILI